jgi:hypothetical protein
LVSCLHEVVGLYKPQFPSPDIYNLHDEKSMLKTKALSNMMAFLTASLNKVLKIPVALPRKLVSYEVFSCTVLNCFIGRTRLEITEF